MTTRLRFLLSAAAAAAALAAGAARAQTVQASSTTMLLGRQDYRAGTLQTAVPLYELLSVDASDIKTGWADLELALSTWGAADVGDVRFWQNGGNTGQHFTGDVDVGYVRALLFDRALSLQLGRQMIGDGIARMVQLDGAEARLTLPYGFGLQAYAGAPVAPRFAGRGGDLATTSVRADFAAGGRASYRLGAAGEVGASVAYASDHGDPSRQDVGADLRLILHPKVHLTGSGWLSLYEGRVGEAAVAATFFPVRHLDLTVDYRHVEPDLFLARDSILSVFVADQRNEAGAQLHWGGLKVVVLDADYHLLLQEGVTGHRARLKGTTHPGGPGSTLGAELSLLRNGGLNLNDNGYQAARLFGAYDLLPHLTGTVDLMGYFFQQDVNGVGHSLTGTATLAYGFARGWKAALAGTAGSTPYLSSQFEFMAKLVYEQTYVVREVK